MTNNDILRRIRYIFDFGDDKMIKLWALADEEVTREQVSNWLKQEDHPDFDSLKDVEFARFLNGLIICKRGKREGPPPEPEERLTNNIIFNKLKIALSLKSDEVMELMQHAELRISNHELSAFFRRPGHKHYRVCQDQVLRTFLTGLQMKFRKTRPS